MYLLVFAQLSETAHKYYYTIKQKYDKTTNKLVCWLMVNHIKENVKHSTLRSFEAVQGNASFLVEDVD